MTRFSVGINRLSMYGIIHDKFSQKFKMCFLFVFGEKLHVNIKLGMDKHFSVRAVGFGSWWKRNVWMLTFGSLEKYG